MNLLAFDVGATSGRASLGDFDGQRLTVREVHRFVNDPIRQHSRILWDFASILRNVEAGLQAGHAIGETSPNSFGIVTWGLDFGLVDRSGNLVQNPFHYRDPGGARGVERVKQVVSLKELFHRTGIQHMRFNTIFHLADMLDDPSTPLDHAAWLLQIPDLLLFHLTGEVTNEYTNATTTQLISANDRGWDNELLVKLDINPELFLEPVNPPADAGSLRSEVATRLGIAPMRAVTVAEHDTASAVVAVPANRRFAFLSCGSWSLLGTETDRPIISEAAFRWNFSNEGGVFGTNRLLKNIMGLWVVEECRREWSSNGDSVDHDRLLHLMTRASSIGTLIDPDAPDFVAPRSMPTAIEGWARNTNQIVPSGIGETLLVIYESLALKCRMVLERGEDIVGYAFEGLHVVGGGCNNAVFCQFTANAIDRPVWAGPAEATTFGNILMQLVHLGQISSLSEARDVMRRSTPVTIYEPRDRLIWDERFRRFTALLSHTNEVMDATSNDAIF